jgi:hypothetical protein
VADIRELIILSPEILYGKPESAFARILSDLRMSIRRAVVASSRMAVFRAFYSAAYDVHLRLLTLIAGRFEGTLAVYATGGIGAGALNVGISDIDFAIIGNWPEQTQVTLLKIFGAITVLSPLYDRASIAQITTIEDLKLLYATDMYMAMAYAKGAQQWGLLWGNDVLADLPPIASDRFVGCLAMEVRRWWNALASACFSTGVVSRDSIFRNSICFKTIAEILRAERTLSGTIHLASRRDLMESESKAGGDQIVELLVDSANQQFLSIAADPRPATMQWFLDHTELFHKQIASTPYFVTAQTFTIEGSAAEAYLTHDIMDHARTVIRSAQQEWPTLRAAWLVPAITFMSPDSLALVLDPGDANIPALPALQRVCAEHVSGRELPSQRIRLYLLLRHAAYQLDAGDGLELPHYTLTPATSPDVFAALAKADFLLYGELRPTVTELGWSRFAHEVALEELNARRGAYARFGIHSRPTLLNNLRNFWRLLQLRIIERSAAEGDVVLAMTTLAICRLTAHSIPEAETDLQTLHQMFHLALSGQELDGALANSCMERVYSAS